MKYLTFGDERAEYPLCLLVSKIDKEAILREYITPFGLKPEEVIVIELYKDPIKKKTSVKDMREFLDEELIETLQDLKVKTLIINQADYFKVLTGQQKAEARLGYVDRSPLGDWDCIYTPSVESVFYDPDTVRSKIARAFLALADHKHNTLSIPGSDIIHFAEYPYEVEAIKKWLSKLKSHKELTCDIETYSLKFHTSGIGTISFAWNKHEGIAFAVDYTNDPSKAKIIREMLLKFFMEYEGTLTFHNIAFDVTALIYQLFMKDILDTRGLLTGLEYMLRDWHDTRIITYLATNTCAGNVLGLKPQSAEFTGDYAKEEIKDITKIPLDELLAYNLIDCLATWFVKEKYWDKMVEDEQLTLYEGLFRDSMVDIIQMQLTGLPVNMEEVKLAEKVLIGDITDAYDRMMKTHTMGDFIWLLKRREADKLNSKWKKKRITAEEVEIQFNPNSDDQKRLLLYEYLNLPVYDRTDSGLPSTGGDTLKKLLKLNQNEDISNLLQALLDHAEVAIIVSTFLPALLNAVPGPDGWHYMCGNFNLGGTISGRLSSSKPNLQNIPSNKKYAKVIKKCFSAPPGWLFCGLDFASLEDKISAVTTQDPNKRKVYTDGYDGHSLRAYSYFTDLMPDIDPNSVDSINSIADKYKSLRTDSKVPTFLLTYDGTWMGIMQQMGWTKEKAQEIENRYKELYKVSREWVNDKLEAASKVGYVVVAFGLRLRTPLLKQVIRNTKRTPFEATAEGRSAGNALGQSYGLLNNRASAAFMKKVRASEFAEDIRPCAHIHDAQYHLIREDVAALSFANEHLVREVYWQDDPAIYDPEVPLGGELSIFWPTWADEVSLPNNVFNQDLIDVFFNALDEREKKKDKK